MTVIKFILFLFVTWIALNWVFNYSTYHRYFMKAAPGVVGLAAINAWAFIELGLADSWLLFLVIFGVGMGLIAQSGKKKMSALMQLSDNPDRLRAIATSGANTTTYFWLSVLLFAISWFVAYLIIFNASLPPLR